jgi:multiple sugar transport system substrate-binding protein
MARKFIAMFMALVLAFTSSGCGGHAEKKNEIVMWLVGTEAQAKTIMALGEDFTKATGVKVICQAISWGDAHSKYLTAIAGDVTPDIGTMGLTWGMEFGNLGAMVDLKKEYAQDVGEIEKKIFPGILRSTQLGNSVYGVPFDLSEQVMYYRTDIIAQPPKTWDELIAMIKNLKTQGKGMVFDWGSLDWIGFSPFLWQAGGDYFNSDYTKVTLDTPEAEKGLNFFAQLYKEGVPKTQVPVEQGMRTGDYPLAITGNWKVISLTVGAPEIKGKWAIAPLPIGPMGKRTAFIGGRVLGIFSKSTMKNEAWEFIKFLFRPDNQVKLYQASIATEDSYLPPNMDTWASLPMDDAFKKVFETQARDAKGPPPVLAWDPSTRFVNEAIQMVVLKGADAKTELKKATDAMQNELDATKK